MAEPSVGFFVGVRRVDPATGATGWARCSTAGPTPATGASDEQLVAATHAGPGGWERALAELPGWAHAYGPDEVLGVVQLVTTSTLVPGSASEVSSLVGTGSRRDSERRARANHPAFLGPGGVPRERTGGRSSAGDAAAAGADRAGVVDLASRR